MCIIYLEQTSTNFIPHDLGHFPFNWQNWYRQALPLLPLMESTSPAGDFGNVYIKALPILQARQCKWKAPLTKLTLMIQIQYF